MRQAVLVKTSGIRSQLPSVAVTCSQLPSVAVSCAVICSHLQSKELRKTPTPITLPSIILYHPSIHHGRRPPQGSWVSKMRAGVVLYWWIVSALVRDALGGAVGLISFCLSHQNFQVNSCRRASGRQFGNELCIVNQLCMPLPLQRKSGKASRTNCWKYNSAAEALVWMLRCYDIIVLIVIILL